MSRIVLQSGVEIRVELKAPEARQVIEDLEDRGERWGFSELTDEQFRLDQVVAVLPDPVSA